jgi:hypothetical protein
MQQEAKEAPIDAAAEQLKRSEGAAAASHRRDAAALWRAVAGMAISLALACLVVMLELTGRAAHRADRMHRHAESLRTRISRLETEVAAARARIATAHRELAAAEELRAILRAPDAGMLALVPPSASGAKAARSAAVARGARAAEAPDASTSRRPQATLALAPRERRAVLIVAGLRSAANDALFVLWWSAAHRAPVRAAEFRTAADGSALVAAALPAGLEVTAAMVTAEHGTESGAAANAGAAATGAAAGADAAASAASTPAAPVGPVLLRGALAR